MGTNAYADWGKEDETPEEVTEVVETNKPSEEEPIAAVPTALVVGMTEENEIPE